MWNWRNKDLKRSGKLNRTIESCNKFENKNYFQKNNSIKTNVPRTLSDAIIVSSYNLPELVTPLKSQLVRPEKTKSKKQNACTTRFCGLLYRTDSREREREERTKEGGGLRSNRMQMSARWKARCTLIIWSEGAHLFAFGSQWLPFPLRDERSLPTPDPDKTYYGIAQLSQQISDRILQARRLKLRRNRFRAGSLASIEGTSVCVCVSACLVAV